MLRRNLLVPVLQGVTFEELDDVSPTLASHGGFSTAEEPIEDTIVKLAELVGELAGEEADELSTGRAPVSADRTRWSSGRGDHGS